MTAVAIVAAAFAWVAVLTAAAVAVGVVIAGAIDAWPERPAAVPPAPAAPAPCPSFGEQMWAAGRARPVEPVTREFATVGGDR